MAVKNIKQLVTNLLNKADSTSNNYVQALEDKQEALIQLHAVLQEEEIQLKDFHKMSVLKEISEESYLEQKAVVDSTKAKIESLKTEMELIDKYKIEDVDDILDEISKVKFEYNEKQQAEINSVKQELRDAKKEYLQKVSEIGKKFDSAISEEHRLQTFLVDMGKQPNCYLPHKYEILGTYAEVDSNEVGNHL